MKSDSVAAMLGRHALILGLVMLPTASTPAVSSTPTASPPRYTRPVTLGPDDKPAFPEPPAGFNTPRDDIPRGRIEPFSYDSKSVGVGRRALVYTPPGYSADRSYPVLYLLHGLGGDETEWRRASAPEVILDNLIADRRAVPMVVVMPNGRARADDRTPGELFTEEHFAAFAAFERDLIEDLIPAVEARYSVHRDRIHRAIAGLSMGGGQALNIGLAHLDSFAWVGAFAPAPNTRPPARLVPEPKDAAARLKLLYLACGTDDDLFTLSQELVAYLKPRGVPHVWHVSAHSHDSPAWRANLYHFAPLLFR